MELTRQSLGPRPGEDMNLLSCTPCFQTHRAGAEDGRADTLLSGFTPPHLLRCLQGGIISIVV